MKLFTILGGRSVFVFTARCFIHFCHLIWLACKHWMYLAYVFRTVVHCAVFWSVYKPICPMRWCQVSADICVCRFMRYFLRGGLVVLVVGEDACAGSVGSCAESCTCVGACTLAIYGLVPCGWSLQFAHARLLWHKGKPADCSARAIQSLCLFWLIFVIHLRKQI